MAESASSFSLAWFLQLAWEAFFVFSSITPAHAATQATLYASPTGSGSTCSLAAPCSLTGAQAKVRTINSNMTGDIIVDLRGGTYTLTCSLYFREKPTQKDSGTNGFNVIYQAYPGETPIISGGLPLLAGRFIIARRISIVLL